MKCIGGVKPRLQYHTRFRLFSVYSYQCKSVSLWLNLVSLWIFFTTEQLIYTDAFRQ